MTAAGGRPGGKGPNRRRWLAGGAAAALLAGPAATAAYLRFRPMRGGPDPERIAIAAEPFFEPCGGDPGALRTAFRFRSGLVLSSAAPGFGGLSGLSRDGDRLLAVTDHGLWLSARLLVENGRLSGLADAVLAPLLGPDGRPLRDGGSYDSESLAVSGGEAFVGIERRHGVWRFDLGRDGTAARGRPVQVPPAVAELPANAGLEALAVASPGHPLAGALLAVAERSGSGADTPTAGWVLTGPEQFAFEVRRIDGFDITDMAFTPAGELLLLERHFTPLSGASSRIRRVAPDAIRPGALLDGDAVLSAGSGCRLDNLEGLAVHSEPGTGATVVTMVSDDNFSPLQRTLLVEFVV